MKLLLPISSLCAAILVAAAMFSSCQKEATLLPAVATEHSADITATNRSGPQILGFSYTVGNAVDLQYRVTNANGTSVYYSKSFFGTSGNTSSKVPGLDECPKIQVRGRLQYNSPGLEVVSWTFTRTTCSPLNGTTSVTAPSSTSWSSIPWVTINPEACPCD